MAPDTKERVTPEGKATDDEFNSIMNSPDNADLRENLNAAEQNPSTTDSTHENPFGYEKEDISNSRQTEGAGWKKATNWALDRKKAIGFTAAGGLLIAAAIAFFTVSTAPVAFLEGIMPDLNTAVGSLFMAHNSLLISKLAYSSEAVSGCKTLSITCKFSTMSKEQVARYEKAGFKIEGETSKFLGRTKPKSITFQNESYSPEEFLKAKETNIALRNADLRANNSSYLSSRTTRFATAVLERFGITKQKPGLSGSTTDRINQLLTAAGQGDASELNFRETTDDKGNKVYEFEESDGTKHQYSEKEYKNIQKSVASSLKERPVLSKVQAVQSTATFGNLLKAASITGYVDLGCSLYNMFGAAAVAAKVNTQYDLIQFAQPVFALIQSIKAGDQTGASDDVSAIATLLTKTDSRKQIWQDGKLIDNPNYGMSAMTSPLVQMSGDGKVRQTTAETLQFTSGLSPEKLLGAAGGAYTWLQQNVTKAGCAVIQNWFVRGASLIVGVVAAIGSGGAEFAISASFSAAIMGAMYVAQTAISNAIQGPDLKTAFDDGSTESIGSALWLGLAGEMGAHAASTGLVPGTISEMTTYQAVMNETNEAYASMEKEDAKNNPFDVTNQYSFLGSAARQYGEATNYGSSPVAIMAGIVALATGKGIGTSTATATAELSPERFQQCSDQSYKTLGIDADAGCNLRYIMMPEDIEKLQKDDSALTIARWMEKNGYVDKDTTTGLPIGYTPASTSQGQDAIMQTISGVASGVVNQFYSTRAGHYGTGVAADYGKFLDFCAYRTLPYGEQYQNEDGGSIGGVEEDWITGKRCMSHDEEISYFRTYTTLLSEQAAEDEEVATTTTSSQSSTSTGGCAANTKSLGIYDKAHDDGKQISVELCEVSSIKLQQGFYTDQDPAIFRSGSGGVIVGASVSEAFEKLGEAALAESPARQLTGKGIRSYEKQEYFYNCYINQNCNNGNLAAVPGTSNHENGTAVDFVLGTGDLAWLRANGGKFGLKELTGGSQPEPWHWSPVSQ